MRAFVIKPKNEREFKFPAGLLKKLGVDTTTTALTQSKLEDIGMYKLMQEADKSKKASRARIMKKLSAR
jgi:hypothetical protein